ncbi:MAG: ribonucrease, partial [Solirubrobacteraceae bacterium]|nr:ribonucrease [Solirubrobacteraceae bacterium]
MELVIAAIVLAGGIVAAAIVFARRTAGAAEGIREVPPEDGALRQREEQLALSAERSQSLERSLDRRVTEIERRERELAARAATLESESESLARLREEHTRALERAAGLSAGQAKQALLKDIEDQARHDSARIIRQVEEETKRDAERRVRSILSVAMQRLAASHAAETTVSVVQLPSDDMKGRIIGREGRNIRALESATGCDLIIDDTPEAVIVSSFNPIRREVAKLALE